MRLSHFVRLVRADEDAALVFPDHPSQQPDVGRQEDVTNPDPGRSFQPDDEVKEHGTWTLIQEEGPKALVVDRRQNYFILTKFKEDQQWYEGTRRTLGTIGRENALTQFEQESDDVNQ